jgi:ribosomal protein S1
MENASPQNTLKLTDLKPKMKLTGKVTKIELFGAFVDVGLETLGLIHISKLQRGQVNKVEDVVKEGEEIDVWVDKVTPDKDRLELTLIRPIQLSWNDIKPGLKKKGTVVRLETFGAFVDIGAERAGLVHVSEMSSEYISDPKELIKQGDEIDVIVLDVDRKKRQIKLSIKAAEEAELIVDDEDEEEEEPPTAMESALRKAFDTPEKADPKVESEEKKKSSSRDELEDILSRTLRERVKTSTADD